MMDDNKLIIKLLINDKNVFIYTMGKTKEEKNIFLFGKFINFQSEHFIDILACGRCHMWSIYFQQFFWAPMVQSKQNCFKRQFVQFLKKCLIKNVLETKFFLSSQNYQKNYFWVFLGSFSEENFLYVEIYPSRQNFRIFCWNFKWKIQSWRDLMRF